jgi:sulfur-carrier protein
VVQVRLCYFARVREMIGIEGETISLPGDVTTPRELANWLAERGMGYAEAFADPERLRCAVDQTMTSLDAALRTPSEIAFFPPVTGG